MYIASFIISFFVSCFLVFFSHVLLFPCDVFVVEHVGSSLRGRACARRMSVFMSTASLFNDVYICSPGLLITMFGIF